MSFSIEVLIPRVVEQSELIFRYGPLSADFSPQKVIMSQIKDSGKFHDTDVELVAFNGEVDGGIIPISTSPSSGVEPSYQLCVPILIQAKNIKGSKRMSFGDDLVEHWITLLLHICPINI
jgi:hypothetical protein